MDGLYSNAGLSEIKVVGMTSLRPVVVPLTLEPVEIVLFFVPEVLTFERLEERGDAEVFLDRDE